MKLFFSPGACALGPQIILRELGLAFELKRVDLRSHKLEDGSDYYLVNPKGSVPAIQLDSGAVLTEGAVLYQYLSDLKPDAGLMPLFGTMERYRVLEWLNYIASEIHKGLGAFFSPIYDDAHKEKMREVMRKKLTFLDQHFSEQEYLTGADFSVADAYLFNVLNWAKPVGIDLTPFTNVMAFHARIAARPHVQAALKAEGLI